MTGKSSTILYKFSILCCLLPLLFGCMKWEYGAEEDFNASSKGVFIINEGSFQYGNATLSYYDPATEKIDNEVFYRANGMKLGDVAQSMVIRDSIGWIVVNNSHVVFAININTFKEVGRITNLTSPRYIHFISDEKAYIECPGMEMENGSTEQMVQFGDYVFVNCWSNQNRILKIDTRSDAVVDELIVGIQPTSLRLDCNNKLWTITDGGSEDSPYGYEAPSLYCIDAESFTIEKEFKFDYGDTPSEVQLNGSKDKLYWINDDIWEMDVTADQTPVRPFLPYKGTIYYGLTVDPHSGDVYIADAIDFVQPGMIYRYSEDGELLDEFYSGVIPGAFCWK